MRIIAGSARRIQLEVAEESSTRPFLEMARGALFNSLAGRVDGARVLDVFAGSGALGLEALSRGAESCLFVERDAGAVAALKRNIARCGTEERCRVIRDDAARALAGVAGEFDLIFADPPFPDLGEWRVGGRAEGLMHSLAGAMAGGGLLIFRLEDGKATPPAWPGLVAADDRRYGRSRILRYRVQGEES